MRMFNGTPWKSMENTHVLPRKVWLVSMATHGRLLWQKFQTCFTYSCHLLPLHAYSWMGTPNRLILCLSYSWPGPPNRLIIYLSYSWPGPPNELIIKPVAPEQRACGASETSENSSSEFSRHCPRRRLTLSDVKWSKSDIPQRNLT